MPVVIDAKAKGLYHGGTCTLGLLVLAKEARFLTKLTITPIRCPSVCSPDENHYFNCRMTVIGSTSWRDHILERRVSVVVSDEGISVSSVHWTGLHGHTRLRKALMVRVLVCDAFGVSLPTERSSAIVQLGMIDLLLHSHSLSEQGALVYAASGTSC